MTTPTTTPPAPQQPPAPTQTPAQPGALAPVQPARPLDSSASYTPVAQDDGKAKEKPQAAHQDSVTKAMLLAWAERLKQRPVTQQKRWEAKRAQALGHQVKEARTVNETVAPARKATPAVAGKDGKPGTGGKQQPGSKQATPAAGTKPQPKPPSKGPEPSGTNRKDAGSARNQPGNTKPVDRKRPEPKPLDRKITRKDSGPVPETRKPVRKDPEVRKASPEPLRKQPEKPRPQPGTDRKPVRKDPPAPAPVRKEPDKIRNDRKPQPEPVRKDSGAARKSPEPVRKPPEKVPVQRPEPRKQPEARKAPETTVRKGPQVRLEPVRKTERQATPEPQQKPDWKKPPEKQGPAAKPSPVAPVAPVRPLPTPDPQPQAPAPKAQAPVPQRPTQTPAPRQKEDKVTTAPEKTDAQPVEVKGANGWGVQLGDGAARSSLSRGEVRTMKQLERYLEACVQDMQKAAEVARVIAEKATEDARRARDLAEKTKAVEGGERLLPTLNRLAEVADERAKKAQESEKGYLTAADRGTALLANLKSRDGAIYDAVLNSPETKPAEMDFYKDRS